MSSAGLLYYAVPLLASWAIYLGLRQRKAYDLASDVPGASSHQLPETSGRHAVAVEPGTRLASILGDAPEPVNSLHHQGIADPGPRLRASARAEDGTIEAVESIDDSFCIGVQWHPEKLDGPHREALFGAFVAAARVQAG